MSDPRDPPRDYTDRLMRSLWRRAPGAMLRLALGDPGLEVRRLLDTNTVLLKRAPDGAALVDGRGGPFVGHVEAEISPSADLPLRVALYGLLLHEQHGLPVRSAVLLLAPTSAAPGAFEMTHDQITLATYQIAVVRLYELPAAQLAQDVDLAPLCPLAEDADLDALVLARDTLRGQAPAEDRADLLAALYILGGRRFDAAWLQRILTREELMESTTYRAILEEGFERGVARGVERGLEEGIGKGIEQGVEKGGRALLRRLIFARFPAEAPGVVPLLERCDSDDIEAIAEALLQAPSAESLHAAILARIHDGND